MRCFCLLACTRPCTHNAQLHCVRDACKALKQENPPFWDFFISRWIYILVDFSVTLSGLSSNVEEEPLLIVEATLLNLF